MDRGLAFIGFVGLTVVVSRAQRRVAAGPSGDRLQCSLRFAGANPVHRRNALAPPVAAFCNEVALTIAIRRERRSEF